MQGDSHERHRYGKLRRPPLLIAVEAHAPAALLEVLARACEAGKCSVNEADSEGTTAMLALLQQLQARAALSCCIAIRLLVLLVAMHSGDRSHSWPCVAEYGCRFVTCMCP